MYLLGSAISPSKKDRTEPEKVMGSKNSMDQIMDIFVMDYLHECFNSLAWGVGKSEGGDLIF